MYQALYRKYRPVDFDSVIGQNPIITTLKNSIIHNNFSHAYLFFGSRGTGKTTVSKIFARNINCDSPKDGIACGKCDSCKISFSKECVDIIEIDAASNNGVDEIRELKNNINLVPSSLKYKVYIIDEVHMLSDSAFNALLKTLEEPPQHVVFILATTDPQKVPETIVSRCQCFSFKKISNEDIFEKLSEICKKEKIIIQDDVLNKIAIYSDGGLRDAIGLLDKLIAYKSTDITIDDFNEINGIISDEEISSFVHNVFERKFSEVLSNLSQFNSCGKNLIQIILQLIEYCRNEIISYYIDHKKLDYPIVNYEELLNIFNEKLFDIKKSNNPSIYIEITFLKFMNDYLLNNDDFSKNEPVEKKSENVINVDNSISEEIKKDTVLNIDLNSDSNIDRTSFASSNPRILNLDEILNVRINNTFATADKNLLKLENKNFDLLKDYSFDTKIGYLVNSLLDSTIRVVGSDSMIISFSSDGLVEENLSHLVELNEVYNKITNSNKNIAIVSDSEWDKLKNDYIDHLKNNIKYSIKKEPDVVLEENKNDDIIVNSAISLFGEDIVEVE
ncbi:MAG: DNA polymerase III subunit gamma/tau [Bacilli bacterium]|nr:DNA polymerase III subunit gamma/tau [Bacilli bacterium]